MKKILVPTDFSECANTAADYAIDLAERAGAEVHFLHLLATPSDWIGLSKEQESKYPETLRAIADAKSQLSEWVKKAEHQGVSAHRCLLFSTDRAAILRHLEDHQMDFLVMGSHGVRGVREMVIGSNAQYVLRNAEVPVLVIKEPITQPIKQILFVSDFSDVTQDTFQAIAHFADVVGAHLDLLYVNTTPDFDPCPMVATNMEKVAAFRDGNDRCTKYIVGADSVEAGIRSFAAENHADLIAIGIHQRHGLPRLLAPSVAERIANHSALPLLSIGL